MLGNTVLDLGACTLSCGIKYVRLSAKEFDVMRFLLQAQSSIISKEVILALNASFFHFFEISFCAG